MPESLKRLRSESKTGYALANMFGRLTVIGRMVCNGLYWTTTSFARPI